IQDKEYIQFLRDITKSNGALLIFDEVITGFRLGFEGAAKYYDIQPDILTYGKIIGGGMPVGAYGASAEIMGHISPDGAVYQAGNSAGNPVAMAAGIAALSILAQPGFYEKQEQITLAFVEEIRSFIAENNLEVKVFTIGSIFWFAFTSLEKIQSADQIDPASM